MSDLKHRTLQGLEESEATCNKEMHLLETDINEHTKIITNLKLELRKRQLEYIQIIHYIKLKLKVK